MNCLVARRSQCTRLLLTLFCLTHPVMAAPAGVCGPPSAPHEPANLSILEGDGTEGTGPATARYTFGTRSVLDRNPIEHDFIVRATGAAMTVDRVETSCGCTSAFVEGHLPRARHIRVVQGEQIRLHVSIAPAKASHGTIHNYVYVYMGGQATPRLTFEMVGTIRPAATFTPSMIDFGKVPYGQTASLTLHVSLDPELLTPGEPLLLACSNRDLQIQPISTTPTPDAPPGRGEQPKTVTTQPDTSNHPSVVREYQASLLAHTRLGLIDSSISVLKGKSLHSSSLALESIPVVGEVTGPFSAFPKAITFDSVTSGKTAKQLITLTGITPEKARHLIMTCTDTHISVRLAPAIDEGYPEAEGKVTLEVVVASTTPIGLLEADVIVTTDQGQQIRLPLLAHIQPYSRPRTLSPRRQLPRLHTNGL